MSQDYSSQPGGMQVNPALAAWIVKVALSKEEIQALQELVNALRQNPQFKKYADEHKLRLVDTRLRLLDALLDQGVLT